jgi:hypothetical protein
MTTVATKAGTGSGALLVISSTVATLASPAPAPTTPPVKYTIAPATTPTGLAILQMKDFTVPSQKLALDEVTNTSSPSSGVYTIKERIPTILDPGEFSCVGIFLPSDPGLIAVQTAFASGIAQSFQIQLPPIAGQSTTGNIYEFNALITENPIPTTINVDKAITVKITLTLVSLMTVLTGS